MHSFFAGSRWARFEHDAQGMLTGFELRLPVGEGTALSLAWTLSRLSLSYVIFDEPAPPGFLALRCRVRTAAGKTLSPAETSLLWAAVLTYVEPTGEPGGWSAEARELGPTALES